jgi:ADP-ribosylglycohydrolase
MKKTTIEQAFRGCMLGGAVGDAIGLPVEFMTLEAITQRFGAEGITGYEKCYGGIGKFSDDTQMSLFTAEGLLNSYNNHTDLVTAGAQALINWLTTQEAQNRFIEPTTEGLILLPELFSRRAPGNTCLTSLRAMKHLGAKALNNSKGCGAVMRMHPVGLFCWSMGFPASATMKIANTLGELTHGHVSGYLSGGALAVMIQSLLNGSSLEDAAWIAKQQLLECNGHEETGAAIDQALEYAKLDIEPRQAIYTLGEGWVGEEALAVALYCALKADSFREGVLMAANHSGDSDSTASIAGMLLGLLHGEDGIPAEWLASLELRQFIAATANDLLECTTRA